MLTWTLQGVTRYLNDYSIQEKKGVLESGTTADGFAVIYGKRNEYSSLTQDLQATATKIS